jgi:hypothetical protein
MKPADEIKPLKPQPSQAPSSTSPKVLMALGRALNEAGVKYNLTHYKEMGSDLIAKAKEKHLTELSSPDDQQGQNNEGLRDQADAGAVKSQQSRKTAGVGISGFPFAVAVPVALAVPILLWALLPDNPYAYYRLLRWVCCPSFAYLAVEAYRRNLGGWIWVLGVTALIYNPVIPVHLNKGLWTVINVASIALAIAGTWAIRQSGKRRAITGERANYE